MKLSRLSNRQFRNLINSATVRFGFDDDIENLKKYINYVEGMIRKVKSGNVNKFGTQTMADFDRKAESLLDRNLYRLLEMNVLQNIYHSSLYDKEGTIKALQNILAWCRKKLRESRPRY